MNQVFELYKNVGWKSLFARIRFWDSPYIEVEKMVPKKATIVELGCGEGVFTNFLGLSSKLRKVIGIEIDKHRYLDANRGLKNVKIIKSDATKYKIPRVDCIVMYHLLHHLTSYELQEVLITNSKKALKRNGKLIIIEIVEKPLLKFFITSLVDYFIVPWLFEGKFIAKKIYFRKTKDWVKLLKSKGFNVKTTKLDHNKPFSHVVFECSA